MSNQDIRTSDSTDAKVTQDLIETLVDGQHGFMVAADHLADDDAQVARRFRSFAGTRKVMADELRALAARYGDRVDSGGSAIAGLHRGWIALKDALTGSDVDAVVNAAVKGEEHAVSEFEDALAKDISTDLRSKVREQLAAIRATKQQLEAITA